jgi:hypothetical protein
LLLSSKFSISLIIATSLAGLSLSGCNTVDKKAYANASCGELKALAQSFDSTASAPAALLNERDSLSRRDETDQERLLNSRRSSPFKQKAAIRAAYEKNGC